MAQESSITSHGETEDAKRIFRRLILMYTQNIVAAESRRVTSTNAKKHGWDPLRVPVFDSEHIQDRGQGPSNDAASLLKTQNTHPKQPL